MELLIRPFRIEDEPRVIELWQQCDLTRPWNDPHKDIAAKMQVNPELFLVGEMEGRIIATCMAGYEGHRGWISYFGVDPAMRRNGIGRRLIEEVEQLLKSRGCPKINLQIRTSNTAVIKFYETLGYKLDDVVSMGKRIDTAQK
ncbi:MAG: GNAT family acetyltransferase [Phycisphaeraceae bacterium]